LKRFSASVIAEYYLFVAVRRSCVGEVNEWGVIVFSMCRQADLRVDRAGVNHFLTGLALMVLVLIAAWSLSRVNSVVLYVSTRSDKFGGAV